MACQGRYITPRFPVGLTTPDTLSTPTAPVASGGRYALVPVLSFGRMALLIDNDVARQVLTMPDAIDAIEAAFRQHGRGDAEFYPLAELVSPTAAEGDYYIWGSHLGAVRDPPRFALRFKSDVSTWLEVEGSRRREKFNGQPGTFMGFILLFDTTDGTLLGLLNDGVVQHVRVGATAGVACDEFARQDASTVGVLGSGGMADVYLEAFATVRDIDEVRVYSTTRENREAFAAEMNEELDADVAAVDSAEAAMRDVDIAACCTNASHAIYDPDWLSPGTFLTNVRAVEIPPEALDAVDRCFATNNEPYQTRVIGSEEERATYNEQADHGDQDTDFPLLGASLAGEIEGRTDDDETIFFENRATGFQFAAVSHLAYELAKDAGLGTVVPLDWFQQDVKN